MMSPTDFFFLQAKDVINIVILIVTVIAIYLGPIRAAKLSVELQSRKEAESRKYSVFHMLMRTRSMTLHPDHVTALNLVHLEFKDDERVIKAFQHYMEKLNAKFPSSTEQQEFDRFFEDKTDRLYELIHQVGKSLGYQFDKRDLEKFSYAPQGWSNDENEARVFRKLVIELMTGRRPLPITQFNLAQINNKFPDPPA